jgi:hypothetical protein
MNLQHFRPTELKVAAFTPLYVQSSISHQIELYTSKCPLLKHSACRRLASDAQAARKEKETDQTVRRIII